MRTVRRTAVALLATAAAMISLPLTAVAAPVSDAGPWTLRAWTVRAEDFTDQGLAVVTGPGGVTSLLTRGDDSIPPALAAQGWRHVGDPDARAGYVLDAYQGAASMTSKLFVLTAPDGRTVYLRHSLVPGEQYHNSFAAISPDGRWFVSGEWGTMRRLLVFAMPSAQVSGTVPLPLAGVIRLDRPVRDVQGCAFTTPTALACSTNDPGRSLFGVPRQLLAVHLTHGVRAGSTPGSVTLLGPIPTVASCGGAEEVEGIDVHGGRLLVSVVTSCTRTTTIFDYVREGARG